MSAGAPARTPLFTSADEARSMASATLGQLEGSTGVVACGQVEYTVRKEEDARTITWTRKVVGAPFRLVGRLFRGEPLTEPKFPPLTALAVIGRAAEGAAPALVFFTSARTDTGYTLSTVYDLAQAPGRPDAEHSLVSGDHKLANVDDLEISKTTAEKDGETVTLYTFKPKWSAGGNPFIKVFEGKTCFDVVPASDEAGKELATWLDGVAMVKDDEPVTHEEVTESETPAEAMEEAADEPAADAAAAAEPAAEPAAEEGAEAMKE